MKHKHAEVIKAFADGIECQNFNFSKQWVDIEELATFDLYDTVRIKPEPQYQEPQYFNVYNNIELNKTMMSPTFIQETYGWVYIGKVRVEK